MDGRRLGVPRRSAVMHGAGAHLSVRPSTCFYLHCALPAIRALRAPLRQEASKDRRLRYRSGPMHNGGSPMAHRRLISKPVVVFAVYIDFGDSFVYMIYWLEMIYMNLDNCRSLFSTKSLYCFIIKRSCTEICAWVVGVWVGLFVI